MYEIQAVYSITNYFTDSYEIYKNRISAFASFKEICRDILSPEKAMDKAGLKVKAPVMKAILDSFSERDETADVCLDKDGKLEADAELRDAENVPLTDNIEEYFKREVLPHVPDAWMDRSKDKIGYEINFTKEFYKYKPLRSLEESRKDILGLEKETEGLLKTILLDPTFIRNEQDLTRIREYIQNNPLKWEEDEDNINRKNE